MQIIKSKQVKFFDGKTNKRIHYMLTTNKHWCMYIVRGKIQWESWMTFSLKLSIWKDILPTWDLDWYNMFNRQKILTEQDSRQPAGVICNCMWTWDGVKNKMQLTDNRHFLRLTLKNCGILIKKAHRFHTIVGQRLYNSLLQLYLFSKSIQLSLAFTHTCTLCISMVHSFVWCLIGGNMSNFICQFPAVCPSMDY